MKLIGEKIIGVIEVRVRQNLIVEDYNRQYQLRVQANHGGIWRSWESLPRFATYPLQADNPSEIKTFTACIAGYEAPGIMESRRRGMDRRHGLKILRDLRLNTPTTEQVIILASANDLTSKITQVCLQNNGRRVMCMTGFNPESPEYFYFGLGLDRKGSFHQESYCTIDGEDNLYFWHHSEHEGEMSARGGLDLLQYHFPLLLGIRPS
jgi:hypothetical protein